MPTLSERHHIYLIKNKKGEKIAWHFSMKKNNQQHLKRFSFKAYGGEKKALEAAIKYRDNFIAENNIDIELRFSKSGIVGVSRTEDIRYNNGKKIVWTYWQAAWTVNGKQITQRFPINTYGENVAKELAIKARNAAERLDKGDTTTSFVIPNPKQRIWRYMDFTKLVSLLENSGLFFAQVDKLGDPFEGSYSRGNERIRKFIYSKRMNRDENDLEKLTDDLKKYRKYTVVNCWHMSDHESAAMWKIYAKSNDAVCIQSTFSKLRSCLDKDIKIGKVKYINYERDWIPEEDKFYPYLHKRESFKHENELRAILDVTDIKQLNFEFENQLERYGGIWIRVNLNHLISQVYIAPNSPNWFEELVNQVLRRFKLKKAIISNLDAKPLI